MDHPHVEIVAEIANAHQGNVEDAKVLALEAIYAGADAIKFQVYFADEFLVPTHPRYEHFKNQSFSVDEWLGLIQEVKAASGKVYCDVFGLRAFRLMLDADVAGVKIHGSDLGNTPLLKEVGDSDVDVIFSAGGSTYLEIAQAVNTIMGRDSRKITLLHGYQSYPTEVQDSLLARLPILAEIFGRCCDIGYQDHVSAESEMAFFLPVMAIGLGARMIEKHVTLDRSARGVDYYSSLEPEEFARFINIVRECEVGLGANGNLWSEGEVKYRRDVRKYAVASRDLTVGRALELENLSYLRVPNIDETPQPVSDKCLIGRRLKKSVQKYDLINKSDVETRVGALIMARRDSKRLPDKALLNVNGDAALAHLIRRVKQARRIDELILCTTTEVKDDRLCELAQSEGCRVYRGPVKDVLGRMLGAAQLTGIDVAVRITGDDILVDPDYVDKAIAYHLENNLEYSDLKSLPSGTEVEVFDVELLKNLNKLVIHHDDTEYLTNFVVDNQFLFECGSVPVKKEHALDWHLTLDTSNDAKVVRSIVEEMAKRGLRYVYRLDDVIDFLLKNPAVLEINSENRIGRSPKENATKLNWTKLFQCVARGDDQ